MAMVRTPIVATATTNELHDRTPPLGLHRDLGGMAPPAAIRPSRCSCTPDPGAGQLLDRNSWSPVTPIAVNEPRTPRSISRIRRRGSAGQRRCVTSFADTPRHSVSRRLQANAITSRRTRLVGDGPASAGRSAWCATGRVRWTAGWTLRVLDPATRIGAAVYQDFCPPRHDSNLRRTVRNDRRSSP